MDRRLGLTAAFAVGLLVTGTGWSTTAARAAAGRPTVAPVVAAATATPSGRQFGVYLAPGPSGAAQVAAWTKFTGTPTTRVLDYLPDDSLKAIAEPDWLLKPYAGQPYALELTVPMLPNQAGVSLAACAKGSYNTTWRTLATKAISYGRGDATIRPGWEMNGNWYRWTAKGQTTQYIGCFRQLVTTMRSVPGARFNFTWSPNLGPGTFAAELAYPGDAYVDTIGPDVYDYSWAYYPVPRGMTTAKAQALAWDATLNGNHGLKFWVGYAKAHKKPLALPEWGIGWRSDHRGGGDNPSFITNIVNFAKDPANNVSYLNYFNAKGDGTHRHQLSSTTATLFPKSAATYQSTVRAAVGSPSWLTLNRSVTSTLAVSAAALAQLTRGSLTGTTESDK